MVLWSFALSSNVRRAHMLADGREGRDRWLAAWIIEDDPSSRSRVVIWIAFVSCWRRASILLDTEFLRREIEQLAMGRQ